MKGTFQVAIAFLVALTILLICVHPATSVMASSQTKRLCIVQLLAITFAFLLMVQVVQMTRTANPSMCAVDPAGAERAIFVCCFLC